MPGDRLIVERDVHLARSGDEAGLAVRAGEHTVVIPELQEAARVHIGVSCDRSRRHAVVTRQLGGDHPASVDEPGDVDKRRPAAAAVGGVRRAVVEGHRAVAARLPGRSVRRQGEQESCNE